ncbi:hypothetical protein AB0L05_34945 [Nonomuraea pusilla]|uniref:hypothetical protein n=1 Tax=Nonomuraea pusilla TaxID=46177 RepID=UPI00332847DA
MAPERDLGNPDTASVLWLAPTSEDGRMPLYVCPECRDLGCGALTMVLEVSSDRVVWRDLGWQTDDPDEVDHDDLTDISPFVFDRTQYEAGLIVPSMVRIL